MKAEPNCSLHEIAPVSLTARLAENPRKIPKAVHWKSLELDVHTIGF